MFKSITRKVAVATVLAVILICGHVIGAAHSTGGLQGTVKNAAGQPVSGAFVKLKNTERHLTFMVISQAQGHYQMAGLPLGQYAVQAIGNGFQSDWSAPVNVGEGPAATVDVSLTAPQPPLLAYGWPGRPGQSTGGEAAASGPPPALPEGEGKRIVMTKCAQCHDTARISAARYSRERWQTNIQTMRDFVQAVTAATDLTDQEAAVALDYLSANFSGGRNGDGPPKPDPNSRLPRTLLQGDAVKYIAVEFEVPRPNVEPHEVTVDTKGNAWVSERTGGKLGKLDGHTLEFTEVSPPPAASKALHLNGIVRGAGDTIWLVDGGPNRRWLNYDTKTSEFNTYLAPKVKLGSPSANTMRVAPNGTVWLSGIASNTIFGLNPATKQFVSYDVPSGAQANKNATPYGMALSGDGKVWFAENAMNKMGRLDPVAGKIDEFDIPLKGAVPRKVGADSEGNIWVGLHGAGKLMKIDYKTAKMTILSPPTENAGVYSVQGDPKSKLVWFSEQMADKIARFDPATQTFTEFPLISAESDSRRIEIDPTNPNRIWWSGNLSNKIGYIEVLDGKKK